MGFKLPSLWSSTRSGDEPATRPTLSLGRAAATSYHAVGIRPGHVCCQASKQFGGLRFLSNDAPRLPLVECTVPSCTCSYSHYSDRRSCPERRAVLGESTSVVDGDRRSGRGRRATDVTTWTDVRYQG
jgi:hypothetical protein